MNVGNHWLAPDGRNIVNDDGRARLPARLGAGEACEATLEVVPPAAGSYVLQLDVVQEGVRWFASAGSPTLDRPVRVEAASTSAAGGAPPAAPALDGVLASVIDPDAVGQPFEMHGVPYDEVTALIRELGGDLLHAAEHVTEWHSFTYFVRTAKQGQSL
jgi:hypothetical protein